MSPLLNHSYLMLGADNLKTLSLSQNESTIQTKKNGKLKHLVHHQEKKKHQVVTDDFTKTEDFMSFTKEKYIWLYIYKEGKNGQTKEFVTIS